MSVRNVTAVALALVVLVSLVSVWFYPSIQDFMQTNPFWNGLRDVSAEFDATMEESVSEATRQPESSTLVIIPYTPYDQEYMATIEGFVGNGGFLLLLDDYGYGNSLLEQLGLKARFSGRPLLDPLFCYKNQWLPRVTDFDADVAEAGIEAVVLNHGTALLEVDQALAWSSESSFLDLNDNGLADEYEPQGPFPVAAVLRLGGGTVLVISDPSILINSMVGRDNNRSFLKYLVERYGEGREIFVDVSHLPRAPLDESKLRLTQTRERIAHPYSIVALVGLVVLLVLRPWQRKGAT